MARLHSTRKIVVTPMEVLVALVETAIADEGIHDPGGFDVPLSPLRREIVQAESEARTARLLPREAVQIACVVAKAAGAGPASLRPRGARRQ